MDPADVKFIQMMIEHHNSAITMAKKYLDTTSPQTRQARVADWARKIASGQAEEIKMVAGWLRAAGESVSGGQDMGKSRQMSSMG